MRRMNLKLAHCSHHSGKTLQGTDAEGELLGLLAWDIFLFYYYFAFNTLETAPI